MQLVINDSSATAGFIERFLSAGSHPNTNARFPSSGYLGVWMKTGTANVSLSPIVVDDYVHNDLVQGTSQTLTADGQWHLYQWNLNDATQWVSFANDADGAVTSAGVTLDGLYFTSSIPENATIYFDDLAWTESGAIAVPEPAAALLLACAPVRFAAGHAVAGGAGYDLFG